jgi:hypothetical protein
MTEMALLVINEIDMDNCHPSMTSVLFPYFISGIIFGNDKGMGLPAR